MQHEVISDCKSCVGWPIVDGKLGINPPDGVRAEIENCTGYDCSFFPYRFGHSPGAKYGERLKGIHPHTKEGNLAGTATPKRG